MVLVLMMMTIYWEPFSKRSIGRFWVKRRRRSLCSQRPVARRKTHRHRKAIYSSSATRRTSASSTSQTMAILRLFKNKFNFCTIEFVNVFQLLSGLGVFQTQSLFPKLCFEWAVLWLMRMGRLKRILSAQFHPELGMTAARLAGFEEQESH